MFTKSQQTNMRSMVFTFMMQMLQKPVGFFREVLCNLTVSITGRAYHNIAGDMMLEFLNGLFKRVGGRQMTSKKAQRASGNAHIWNVINLHMREMTGVDVAKTRWNASARLIS